MLQVPPLRTPSKAQTVLLQDHPEKGQEDDVISTKSLRSQKTVLSHTDEQQLFEKVLLFLKEFFGNEHFHKKVTCTLKKEKSVQDITNHPQNQRILSFKKMNMGSKICFEGEVTRKDNEKKGREEQENSIRGKCKKISIFVMEEDFSQSSDSVWSDSILSESSVKTIRSIELPQIEMSKETIALIYEQPQPFLINLSLCLMIRYCLSSKRKVCFEDSAWVLSVATVVAYKLYYDEEIEGLIDCFMGVMKVSRKDLIDLERCFLEEISYNTIIYNHEYHFVLANLLSFQAQKEL